MPQVKGPWRSPEQTQAQTWNEYEDAHYDAGNWYDARRYGEYMKGDRKGKGWNNKGQAKGKMAKGQTWTNGKGNTNWKGSNNRGVANGQYNGQQQHGHHNTQQQWNQDQKLCIATFIFMAGTSVEACFSNIRSVAIPIETATCSRGRIKGRENMGKQEFKTIEGTHIT